MSTNAVVPKLTETKKRSLDKSASQIVDQLKKTSCQNFPVHIICGHNLHQGTTTNAFSNYFKEFPGQFTATLPCDQQKYQIVNKFIDPATRLVFDKDKYLSKLQMMKTTHAKRMERKKGFKKYEQKNIRLMSIAKFAEHLETEPDEYFVGNNINYDWYYSQGNLTTVEFDDENYIMKVGGPQSDKLSIIPFTVNKINDLVLSKDTLEYELQKNASIYEISTHGGDNNTAVFAAVRQKTQLTLFAFQNIESNDYTELDLRRLKTFESRVPFIGSTFDTNSFCTLNVNRDLQVWDISVGNKKSEFTLSSANQHRITSNHKTDDNWMGLQNYGFNVSLFTDRCCMKLIDMRMENSNKCAMEYCWKKSFEFFESVSCITNSQFEHLFYVGSTFKLFGVDIRQMNNKFDVVPQIRWTHNLNIAPSILKTSMETDGANEWLACSNNVSGDLKVCINSKNNNKYESHYMPFKPKNIRDSYTVARTNGKCLKPSSNIHERINYCTTGLTLHRGSSNNSNQLLLITQNSIGDLFYQKHAENDDSSNFKVSMRMHSWMENLDKTLNGPIHQPSTFYVTDVVNLRDIPTILKSEKLKAVCEHNTHDRRKDQKVPKWQQSIDSMKSYCDALASDMLSIWDINEIKINGLDKTKAVGKVSDWFERSYVPPMVSVPLNNITLMSEIYEEPINENSIQAAAKDIASASLPPDILKRRLTINKSKSNPNKSRHVQGF